MELYLNMDSRRYSSQEDAACCRMAVLCKYEYEYIYAIM